MANASTNWIHDKSTVNERDKQVAEKAERFEKRKIKNGYRWVRIDPRTRVLVECDKHGTPTELGRRQIANIMHT